MMTREEIAKLMDISAVQAQNTYADIDACCRLAEEFGAAAAGGVRTLETLKAMYEVGVRRFGVGVGSVRKILEAAS